VAARRAEAKQFAARAAKKGQKLRPVEVSGRTIARTFWGQAWCDNLESYSDYENRLPRGRTYVRNGSVIDLQISAGKITSLVSGSEIYKIKIEIARLGKPAWSKVKRDCSQSIDSLMDLLQGRFSQGVMERLTRQREGLFPQPKEIKLSCSCPDWAGLCKHVAATLYGVGARLDQEPELLFVLRDVDHLELIAQAVQTDNLDAALRGDPTDGLAEANLGELFGIDLESAAAPASSEASGSDAAAPRRRRRPRRGTTLQPTEAASSAVGAVRGKAIAGKPRTAATERTKAASANKKPTSRKKAPARPKKRAAGAAAG
jgi:uncharacterized Zn finger protein